MTKNPFTNALLAIVYISLIALFFYYGTRLLGPIEGVIAPATMLSLFVLSAAVMAMIFFYHPVRMYLDGSKKEAVSLLTKTIAVFAGATVLLIIALFISAAALK